MLTTAPSRQYEDDIDLLRYGRFLAAYSLVVAAAALLGLVIGLIWASRVPLLHQASVTLNVRPADEGSAIALTPATARALFANIVLVSEVLAELQLDRQGLTPDAFIAQMLVIQPVPSTTLVRLTVTLPEAVTARRAADLLASKAVALNRRLESEGARATLESLKVQVAEASRRLDEAEAALLGYQTRAQVEVRAADALGQLARRLDSGRLGIDLDVGMLKYEIGEPRAARRGARPDTVPEKQFADLYRAVMELKRHETNYEVARKVYMDVAERYGEASGRAVENVAQLQIVDAPTQPGVQVPRRRAQYAILGALLGLAAGVVLALIINWRRVAAIGPTP